VKLIDNIRSAWRLATVWVGSAAVAFGVLPAKQQEAVLGLLHIPMSDVPAYLGIAFIVSRVIKQNLPGRDGGYE